jgi:hypothetical protein
VIFILVLDMGVQMADASEMIDIFGGFQLFDQGRKMEANLTSGQVGLAIHDRLAHPKSS